MATFTCRLYDKRGGADIGREVIDARTKTEARKVLAKLWAESVPRDARACGFVPFSDVRIVWVSED